MPIFTLLTIGNPVKFRDPSGHVPVPVWIDRAVDALLFVVAHTRITPGVKPPVEVSPQRQELATAAGSVAVTADTVATAFSVGGAMAEGAICLAGAVEPSPVVEAGGLGVYYGIVNRLENDQRSRHWSNVGSRPRIWKYADWFRFYHRWPGLIGKYCITDPWKSTACAA